VVGQTPGRSNRRTGGGYRLHLPCGRCRRRRLRSLRLLERWALASPFAGIFKTASTTSGTVVVWADILAVVVYAIAAVIVAKVVSMSTDQRARRSA